MRARLAFTSLSLRATSQDTAVFSLRTSPWHHLAALRGRTAFPALLHHLIINKYLAKKLHWGNSTALTHHLFCKYRYSQEDFVRLISHPPRQNPWVSTDLRMIPESFQHPYNWVKWFIEGYPLSLLYESRLPYFTTQPWKENSDPGIAMLCLATAFQKWQVLPKEAAVSFSFPPSVCYCHKKLHVTAAMLTRVNGRISDNIRNDLSSFRSQTCSLQVDRVASFHRLDQVSANLRKGQRSALAYSPLGKQKQKESTWQKYNRKLKNPSTSHSQKANQGILAHSSAKLPKPLGYS